MKLSFSVSEEDYLSALLYLLRRKNRTPMRIFTSFVLTAGQFLGVLALAVSGLFSAGQSIFLVVLSAIVMVLNGIFYLPTPWRARMLHKKMKRSGQWDEEYEKRHTLTWEGDKLVLRYGKVCHRLPAASVSRLADWRGELLVMTGEVLFCLLPPAVWEGQQTCTREAFRKELLERKFRSSREEIAAKRAELAAAGRKPYRYSYDRESYLAALREAHRKAYTTSYARTPAVLLRLLAAALLLAVLFWPVAWGYRLLALLAALIFLYPFLQTFSPLLGRKLQRDLEEILSFAPGREAEFYETEKELIFLGDIHCLAIPWADILTMKRMKSGAALYLSNRMIVTVPDGGTGERPDRVGKLLHPASM